MSKIGATERAVQKDVVAFFRGEQELGYRYLGDLSAKVNKNIRTDDLRTYLLRAGYGEALAKRAVEIFEKEASDLADGLYEANKRVYSLLRYGIKVAENAGDAPTTVYMIDWRQPENNDFAIGEEVTVLEKSEKRPDLVVYVNGIALAVMELKKSSVSIGDAIRQNLTNQKTNFIEGFFSTVQLTIAGNPSEGVRYGTIYTPEKYYLEWKNDGHSEDDETAEIVRRSEEIRDKLRKGLYCLFHKRRFLELVHDFVIFDKGVKKVCRYNQYYGIKAAQARLKAGKGGIIWHTQGSGKTLTMVWLSKWILSSLEHSRVLIITDREELDDQVEETYKGVGETRIVRTSSCADLVERLNRFDGGALICSLIHKFGGHAGAVTDKDYDDYISELQRALPKGFEAKDNFYVFVDECHRSQSGKLHEAMKCLLPKAVFIGFTGTPLLKKKKKTSLEIFGGYIHTYKFDQGVRDKTVLDLRYEARDVEQEVMSQDKIDAWFNAKTEGLTPRAKAKLKQKWGNMQTIFSSKDRLNRIANDILLDMHTKPRLANGTGNAMLVADDIFSAIRYWKIFQEKGLKQCAVITSYRPRKGDLRTDTSDIDETTVAAEKYDLYLEMLNGREPEDFEDEVKKKFIYEPANMKLLIVVDKLLTGFDAPPCTYLYIDKKMQDLGLFQAVCRVNRLDGEGKDFGYIVDYKQLFGFLSDAVDKFTSISAENAFEGFDEEDITGLLKNRLAESKKLLDSILDELDEHCEGVPSPRDEAAYIHYFCGVDKLSEEEQDIYLQAREKLYCLVGKLIRAYSGIKGEMRQAGYSDEQRVRIADKVRFYTELRATIGRASADFIDLKAYEADMRFLIDNYIMAEDSKKIGSVDDFTFLDFIAGKQDKEQPQDTTPGGHEAVAETIENNTRKKIVQKMVINPKFYERMSAILASLILNRKQGVIRYEEMLEKYRELAERVERPEEDISYPESVRSSEALRSLFDNTGGDEKLAIRLHDAVMTTKMDHFRGNKQKENKIKKGLYEILHDKDEVERIFKIVVEQEEY